MQVPIASFGARGRGLVRLLVGLLAALLLAGCVAASAGYDITRDPDAAPDELAHQPWRPSYEEIINSR